MSPKTLWFITGNQNKLKAARAILATGNIILQSKSFDISEIQGTPDEICIAKCRAASAFLNGPCLVEDTSLCFEALGGLPGPYIKQFTEALGHDGLNTLLEGFSSNKATALSTLAYTPSPSSPPVLFTSSAQGRIVPPRGPTHFGWQPVFQSDETGKTFAEMSEEGNLQYTPRYKAMLAFRQWFESVEGS